jgi:acyl carrier protein
MGRGGVEMEISKRIHGLIFEALEAIRETLPKGSPLPSDPDAPLLESAGGALDSLGVVNLMVEVEGRIQSALGHSISLVPALAELPDTSPFRTVGALAAHIANLLPGGTDA